MVIIKKGNSGNFARMINRINLKFIDSFNLHINVLEGPDEGFSRFISNYLNQESQDILN